MTKICLKCEHLSPHDPAKNAGLIDGVVEYDFLNILQKCEKDKCLLIFRFELFRVSVAEKKYERRI